MILCQMACINTNIVQKLQIHHSGVNYLHSEFKTAVKDFVSKGLEEYKSLTKIKC